MVGAVSVRVTGFRELEGRLRELPNRTRGSVLTRTLRVAAEPIRAAAQANAPDRPPLGQGLKSSLIISTRVTAGQRAQRPSWPRSTKEISIGPSGVPVQYAHLTEFGSVHNVGTAWFTRAYEAHKAQAVELIRTELARQIERSLARGRGR